MKIKYAAILLLIFLIEGCGLSYPIRKHTASVETVNTIKEKYKASAVKINIERFSSNKPDISSILCRLSGPVTPPNGESFNSYIIDALRREIKFSGIYSKDSNVTIKIHFEKIDFSATAEGSKWSISAKIYTDNNYFQVNSEYEFITGFSGIASCARVSEAFPKVVEKFIINTITHPEFEKIMSNQ